MNQSIRGTALVAGASSGIGAAIVNELGRSGWRVICAARRIERLEALVAGLDPGVALALELDVTSAESVNTLSERLPRDWREIDVLVNNAGHDIGGRRRFDEGSIDDWLAIVETNTIGTMRVAHAIVPAMIARGRGHIVNIGSIAGAQANAGSSAYCTSKFAVNGLSKALFEDFRGKGVRVTQIMPGVTRTEFSDTRWHGDKSRVDEFYGRFPSVLSAEDVARSVRFAIEQPAHVTISELVIVPA